MQNPVKQAYRFDDFELDLDAQQLRRHGEPVRLERRALNLLILLVDRHGSLVPRDDIIAALWPARVIIDFDSGLNTLVRKVRAALGDSSEKPRFIETVPGRGYRFIAPLLAPTLAEAEAPAADSTPTPHWRPAILFMAVLLAIGAAAFVWQQNSIDTEQTRMAILPFENLSGEEELGYLAAGIAEDTRASLTQIDLPGLSLIGVVSSRALAGPSVSLQRTGRELDVDYLVVSSLRAERSRIRVTSRLIRVADNAQVWSASFDRELTNVLGLQRELSIAIAEQIRQHLSPEVLAAISDRQTKNPEAYRLYLKGRYEWTRFQPDSVSAALQYYQQAVEIDPAYALAWAGIAHALITSPVTAEADPEAIRASARDALERALEFGADLPETQHALASFYFFLDQDLSSAESTCRKAVALDQNSAMAHMFLGIVLSQRGKYVEARAMLRRARELDPLFPLMFANSAQVALHAGDPQEALELATQAIAINPEFWVGHLYLGGARFALGDYEKAAEAFAAAGKLSGNSARAAASRAFVLAKMNRHDEARDILAELAAPPPGRQIPSYEVAVVYAGLGETDTALEWLDRALQTNTLTCLSLPIDPQLEPLRSDLRFDALTRRCRAGATSGGFR